MQHTHTVTTVHGLRTVAQQVDEQMQLHPYNTACLQRVQLRAMPGNAAKTTQYSATPVICTAKAMKRSPQMCSTRELGHRCRMPGKIHTVLYECLAHLARWLLLDQTAQQPQAWHLIPLLLQL